MVYAERQLLTPGPPELQETPDPEELRAFHPGTQTLAQTYLLVAVVRSLLLNTVGELGARIFGVVPCGCTWKQVQKRKVTPFTDGFQAAAKMSLFPPSPLISSLPHLQGPLPAGPTGKAGPLCQICRRAFSLHHWYLLTNTQVETSKHKPALIAKTCTQGANSPVSRKSESLPPHCLAM